MSTMAHTPVLRKLKDRTGSLVAATAPQRCPGDLAVSGLALSTWLFCEGGSVLYLRRQETEPLAHVAIEHLREVLNV